MLALRVRRSRATSAWPSQAAMWRAVRPSRSILLTSMPSLSKSSTPLTSPRHAMKSSCMVESRFSGTVSSAWSCSGLLRIGSNDDCRPKLNRWLFRRGSSEAWRVNCRLRVFRSDPDDNCREMPRFSCAAMFSMAAAEGFRTKKASHNQSMNRRINEWINQSTNR